MSDSVSPSYERCIASYTEIIGRGSEIDPKQMLMALSMIIRSGSREFTIEQAPKYAADTIAKCRGALALNVAGMIQQPFDEGDASVIENHIVTLGRYLPEQENTAAAPTNERKIATDGRKA